MKIGFLVQNSYCGHSYVSKTFADALINEDEIYMFATEGTKHTDNSFWENYNVYHSTSKKYGIDDSNYQEFFKWIADNKIEAIFLNEYLDWNLIHALKEKGIKIFGYIYYCKTEDVPYIRHYFDAMFIPSENLYEILVDLKNCHFIPWGIKTDDFKVEDGQYDFIHSAGWGGIHFRKCTPEIVRAFDRLGEGTMFLHTQIPYFDTATKDRIQKLRATGRLKVKLGTTDNPDFYNQGKVYLGVSKFEGLGLFVPEALACGLPVVTTNRLPMAQFIEDEHNGWLIDSEVREGVEGFALESYKIDEDHLLKTMQDIMKGKYDLKAMKKDARSYIIKNHDFETVFKPRVKEIIKEL